MTYFAGHKELNFLNPEAHQVFRKLVEDLKIGIFMADAHGRLFYVNRAFVEAFELQHVPDTLGKNWADICFSDRQQRDEFTTRLESLGTVKEFETVRVFSHGRKDYLLINATCLYSDQENKIGLHGFIINISDRRKLEEDLFLRHRKLEQILDFCNSLGEILQVEELTKYIVHQTAQILDVKRCSLMFVDDSTKELYVSASYGLSGESAPEARVALGQPVAGLIALQKAGVLIDNIEDNAFFKTPNKGAYSRPSFMSTPVFHGNKLMGVLNVSEKQHEPFSKIDLKVLETIAQQAAVNINKAQALSTFEHLAQTDPMTGLLNFRSFTQKIEEEIHRAKRYALPLSLMMIDLDNFKTYNDTYGHPEGDKLLKRVAEIFRTKLRATEYICRYGGDEFGVILPQTDSSQAAVAGEKIRELIATEFAKDRISISVGIAQFKEGSKESFINQADKALYHSKKNGRNRVSLAPSV